MLGEYHTQRLALSRFFIGAIVLSEPVLDVVRRELRKISPDVKIEQRSDQGCFSAGDHQARSHGRREGR